MADFIPGPDNEFDDFTKVLGPVVIDAANPLKVPFNLVAQWTAADTAWTASWSAWLGIDAIVQQAKENKDGTRASLTAVARAINAAVQANPTVTDAERAVAGLPVHKTGRSPTPSVETHPVLYRVDQEHLIHRLWFADQSTPGSKAKPAAAEMCEVRQLIVVPTGPAPTDPDAMPLLAFDKKSPHRTDFDTGEVGHTAYYVERWIGKNGGPGPWSLITGYLVT